MSNMHPLIDAACAALGTHPDASEVKVIDGLLHDAVKRVHCVPPLFEYYVIETIVRTLGLTVSEYATKASIEAIRPAVASVRSARIPAALVEDVADLQTIDN